MYVHMGKNQSKITPGEYDESKRFYSTSFGRASAVVGRPTTIQTIKTVVPVKWMEESERQQQLANREKSREKSLKPGPEKS